MVARRKTSKDLKNIETAKPEKRQPYQGYIQENQTDLLSVQLKICK